MRLQSVSNTAGEVAIPRPATVTERRTDPGPDTAIATTKFTQRRLVVGKSDRSLHEPRGDTAGTRVLSLIGADERTRILETDEAPWRMICALEIDAPWGSFLGTGWLAGPRTIITAGHCVFSSKEMGGWAEKITVKLGADGDEKPAFDPLMATKFSTVDIWKDKLDPDFDIGAIHLADPIGDRAGWFQVASLTDAQLQDHLVNVSGYPADPGNGTQQWWAKNRVKALTPRRIFYDVDTTGGQSGAPVFILDDRSSVPTVVGIHAYGIGGTPQNIVMQVNSAPRIIPEVVEQIQAWIDADRVA